MGNERQGQLGETTLTQAVEVVLLSKVLLSGKSVRYAMVYIAQGKLFFRLNVTASYHYLHLASKHSYAVGSTRMVDVILQI